MDVNTFSVYISVLLLVSCYVYLKLVCNTSVVQKSNIPGPPF